MIIGIDPGQTGAIAAIEEGKIVAIIDMPTMARLHGQGKEVDPYALSASLLKLGVNKINGAVLEAVGSMPGQGIASTFRFGESVGAVKGVLGALSIPVRIVTPGRWKKSAGLLGKDKDAARTLAIQMHPEIANHLTRKKDVGRADAVCIAHFG